MEQQKTKTKTRKINIDKTDIIIFLIVFIIFGFALLSFFPGLLTSDCIDQINQAQNNAYYVAHPVIHSMIIGNLTKLGGIWVPALFQIIVFSLIWTYAMKVLRRYNDGRKNKILQIILTLAISILPLNFLYSITLWKDILYSYSMLLSLVFIYIGIKEKFNFTISQIILISLSNVAVMKFRLNGLPIGILMFAILMICNIVKNKNRKQIIAFIASFVVCYSLFTIPTKMVNVIPQEAGEGSVLTSTEIYCIGALLNSDIQLEEDEEEFLNTIFDIKEWKENYNPYSASGILYNPKYNQDNILGKSKEANEKLKEIVIKYTKQKPGTVLKHFLNINSIWWSVQEYGGMHGIVTSNSWVSEMSNGKYDNHPILEGGYEFLNDIINKSIRTTFRYNVIYRPAVSIIISIVLAIAVCFKTKKKSYLLILLPMILNVGTYILLITSQDHRYFYPCHLTCYFMIAIFIAEFIKNKKIEKKNTKKIDKENPKTLVIIPAYNEEAAIQKVVESVYNEKIENLDVVVVNDGSKDTTFEKASKTKAIAIDSPNNLGIGGAVQTGYLYAYKNNYDIAIQVDGDGQHDPKYIRELIKEIKNGNNLVIGSRFIEKSSYEQTFMRMLGINIISYIIKTGTGKKIYDTTSGYRACDKYIIEEFSNNYPYDYPEPCSTMNVIKLGYEVKEIPVEMKKRETGKSFITPIKSISYMFKVILSLIISGIVE